MIGSCSAYIFAMCIACTEMIAPCHGSDPLNVSVMKSTSFSEGEAMTPLTSSAIFSRRISFPWKSQSIFMSDSSRSASLRPARKLKLPLAFLAYLTALLRMCDALLA